MLFSDGIILSIEDLREHDNFVLDVASTEAIELSSKLAVAQREIGYERHFVPEDAVSWN